MPHDAALLNDMLEAALAAQLHVAGLDEATFASVRVVRSAVAYELIVIGEAANLLSGEARVQHPGVPWPEVVALRNRVTHGYFAVDWSTVYGIVQQDLPVLIESIRQQRGTVAGDEEAGG